MEGISIRVFTEEMIERMINGTKSETIKHTPSFLILGVAGLYQQLQLKTTNPPVAIVEICNWWNSDAKEDRVKTLTDMIDILNTNENSIILIQAYASYDEFPESEYCLPGANSEEVEGKKVIPLENICIPDAALLEECGFVSINNYVQYEFSTAFIYPNKLGSKIIEVINNNNIHGGDNIVV